MILYYFEACPFCQKVLKMIDELGISDRIDFRDTSEFPTFREELIKLNGRTQVPCLVVDGKPMLESDDIVIFLRKNFGS
ncbi:MAG: glutathione S-transferase N-terminal domain-containing protein [Bdellovibrionales bacterium]|nr:glutathione S-transferase N-terminal domain-containing protein [Bdellovibrionales bacterium]